MSADNHPQKKKCNNNYYLKNNRHLHRDENLNVDELEDYGNISSSPKPNPRNDNECGNGDCCKHNHNSYAEHCRDKTCGSSFRYENECCNNTSCVRDYSSCPDIQCDGHDEITNGKYQHLVPPPPPPPTPSPLPQPDACESKQIYVKLLNARAKLPFHGTDEAAGLDVFCSEDTLVPGKTSTPVRVPLGIAVHLPPNTYGRLTGRSSTSLRGLFVIEGIIDADYRGRVDAMVHNFSDAPVLLKAGERFAQLIITPCINCNISQVEHLSLSARGTGGFGSTGHA